MSYQILAASRILQGISKGSLGEKVVNKIKVAVAQFCSFEVILHTCPNSFSDGKATRVIV